MNVMAQAHKLTKLAFKHSASNLPYREVFAIYLRQAHKEHKAVQAQQVKADKIADLVFQAGVTIGKLENFLPLASGYIVTTGQHRICVNAEVGYAEHILKVPAYAQIEDARYYANRIKNGHGEQGQVEVWADRIRWEIQEQKALIQTLQSL